MLRQDKIMITYIKSTIKRIHWLYSFFAYLYRLEFNTIKLIHNSCYYFFRLCKIKSNKIVFSNFYGLGYGDNPKYIAEEIIRRDLDYEMVWLLRKDLSGQQELPPRIRVVEYGSIQAIYEMTTARLWIDNVRQPVSIKKRYGQYYIQTWHGGIGIKRVEKDVLDNLCDDYIRDARADSRKADLFISDSTFITNLYKNSFWYDGKILECGTPRNDILLNPVKTLREEVRSYFDVGINRKIVLYAPTFRNNCSLECYDIHALSCLDALSQRFGGEWIMFIRLHPNLKDNASSICNSETIYNATSYPDMQVLLSAVDIVITDYSSLMFDFALRKNPCFLYATDIEEYKRDRNFYFQIDELPFPLATNNDELTHNIKMFDNNKYKLSLDEFYAKVGCQMNGRASALVVDHISQSVIH